MRGYFPAYDLRPVNTLQECLGMLERKPGVWRPFAGGTDLMVLLEADQLPHRKFIDLSRVPELHGIELRPNHLRVGALTTYTQIVKSPLLTEHYPLLGRAALETGAVAIQNRGTLGGNIANASPAADTPPALLVYDAELELISVRGTRTLRYVDFHTGYKKTLLQPDELIQSVLLPRLQTPSENKFEYYRKVGARRAQAISKVCFAGVVVTSSSSIHSIRIALGSVGPVPLRCPKTEDLLTSTPLSAQLIAKARATLESEISPIDDIRSTSEYRLRVTGNLLEDFLGQYLRKHSLAASPSS